MNVALVCDYSLEYLGGAQSAFLDEAQILQQAGHSVTLFSPVSSRGGETAAATPEGVSAFPIPARWTIPGVDLPLVRNTAALRARLRAAFRARAVDVVHLHSEFGLTAAAIDVAAELGIPVIQTVHTFFWQARLPRAVDGVAAAAVRRFARYLRGFGVEGDELAPSPTDAALRGITLSTALRVDTVISPSAHQAARLQEAGAPRVTVIENASPEGSSDAHPLTEIDLPVRVVWIGRLVPEKRVVEFARAAVAGRDAVGPGALSVEIIGSGPLEEAVREVVTGAEADIHLLGRLGRDEVRTHIRGAHLVALTSLGFDNQPVVVVEAFTEARSVLYVDENLKEGLADGGILAPADEAGMAEALAALVRNPETLIERSHAAHEAASVFSPAHHAARVLAVYEAARARSRA